MEFDPDGRTTPVDRSATDSLEIATDLPLSGAIAVPLGMHNLVRIPVPGTNGLAVELSPRGWKGESTSHLFIQDKTGNRHLRLDYGFNKQTNRIEWHWNQKGTFQDFKIKNHTSLESMSKSHGFIMKNFKALSRSLIVVAAAADFHSIVKASNPIRRSTQVATAWATARSGCFYGGARGALIGSAEPGLGNAIGAFVGCAVGGFIGYKAGEELGGTYYDWIDGTIFTEVPAQ